MRILYVCTYYHKAMIFRDSMNYLEERGHTALAFNAAAKGTIVDEKFKSIMDDKVVHRECFRKIDRVFFHMKQWKIVNSIIKNVNIADFDIIHSHTLFNGGWATYLLYKKYGTPYVVSVRDTDLNVFLKIPIFKTIAKKVVNSASAVVFLSNAYQEDFLKLLYADQDCATIREKCEVIPNGVEPFWLDNIFEKKREIHNPLELLCVGKIDKRKNLGTTINVVKQLNEDGIEAHLTVIGQVLDENINSLLQNSKNTSVLPFMSKSELISIYRVADIFVMPSFTETFGRVYAEAMTQGLPVIYTRGQGFDGNFEEGTVGYSVKADDVEEIVTSIKKIIGNYKTISANCIDRCTVFNWEDISERLEQLYIKAIEGAKR